MRGRWDLIIALLMMACLLTAGILWDLNGCSAATPC